MTTVRELAGTVLGDGRYAVREALGAGAFGTYHQAAVQHTLAQRVDAQTVGTLDDYQELVSYLQHFLPYEQEMLDVVLLLLRVR